MIQTNLNNINKYVRRDILLWQFFSCELIILHFHFKIQHYYVHFTEIMTVLNLLQVSFDLLLPVKEMVVDFPQVIVMIAG